MQCSCLLSFLSDLYYVKNKSSYSLFSHIFCLFVIYGRFYLIRLYHPTFWLLIFSHFFFQLSTFPFEFLNLLSLSTFFLHFLSHDFISTSYHNLSSTSHSVFFPQVFLSHFFVFFFKLHSTFLHTFPFPSGIARKIQPWGGGGGTDQEYKLVQ